jgi:hypothetical protein
MNQWQETETEEGGGRTMLRKDSCPAVSHYTNSDSDSDRDTHRDTESD